MQSERLFERFGLPTLFFLIVAAGCLLVPQLSFADVTPPTANLAARYIAGIGIHSSGGNPDLITEWDDQSGNGYNLTQATQSAQPYNATDTNGNPIVRFPFGTTNYLSNAAIPLNSNNSSIFVIRKDFASNLQDGLLDYIGYPTQMLGTYFNSNGADYLRLSLNGAYDIHPPLNETLTGGVFSGVATGYSIDASSTAAATGQANTTGIDVGAGPYSGDIYEILVYNTAVTPATVDAIRAYAETKYGLVASYSKQVVMVGDSNTQGSVLTGANYTGENYPRLAFPSDWEAYNFGSGGSTFANWLAANSIADLMLNAPLSRNVMVVMLGTNDINSFGHTAAQTFSDLDTFIGQRQAAGWEVWVSTILPINNGGSEAIREQYNTLLTNSANYTHVPSKIIDFRTDFRIGSDVNSTTWGIGDGLHVNANGAAVMAEYVYKALNGGVAPVTYSVTGSSTRQVGQNVTLTLTASGGKFMAETITPSDGGAGGTFTPPVITTTVGQPSTTVQYERPSGGTSQIAFTNNGILNDPSTFSFQAVAPPSVDTAVASNITTSGATLGSSLTSTGGANAVTEGFNWGPNTFYGQQASLSGSFGAGAFSQTLTGLSCGTSYHFQAFATNIAGQGTSSDQIFTTAACPVAAQPGPSVTSSSGSMSGPSQQAFLQQIYAENGKVCPATLCPPGPSASVPITPPVQAMPALVVVSGSLSRGSTGPEVTALQIFLNTHDFTVSTSGAGSSGHESQYFGPATDAALKRFQCAEIKLCSGTPTTTGYGATGLQTRTALNAVAGAAVQTVPASVGFVTTWLHLGTTNSQVKRLQQILNAKGYLVTPTGDGSPGHETTHFGPATDAALKKFQCAELMICAGTPAATGYGATGPKTREALAE